MYKHNVKTQTHAQTQTHVQTCMHTHSKHISDPSKYLRTVTIFLLGISYLSNKIFTLLTPYKSFPINHQNRIQSTWMLNLLLLEFLSLLLDNQKLESHLTPISTCLYLLISQVLSSLLSELWRERVFVSCTAFLLPLTPESVLDKIVTQLLTPAVRIIVLKFNTDSLWSCFSLAPDAENYCLFTVNSERNVQPNSHPWACNGILKHLQHLKSVGEEFWHQHVWHAALKTRSILTCILLDFLY